MTSTCLLSLVLAASPLPGRSVQQVTATPKEAAVLAEARDLLASTKAGKPVADLLEAEGVGVHYGDLPAHMHGGYGKSADGKPIILLARPSKRELLDPQKAAFALAMTLAHEGTHARQDIIWKLPACVEKEAEAFLKELEVQKELVARGFSGPSFEAELRYRVMMHAGGVDEIVRQVRDGYASEEFLMTKDASKEQKKEWEEAHALDGYRPVRNLLKAARSPERRLELKRANSHFEEVLQAFKLGTR